MQVFIPYCEATAQALHAGDRLLPYQVGYLLLAQVPGGAPLVWDGRLRAETAAPGGRRDAAPVLPPAPR